MTGRTVQEAQAVLGDVRETLHEVAELLDNYADVHDGESGPVPNRAMSLITQIEDLLARIERVERAG
jgi:hypothetical protein